MAKLDLTSFPERIRRIESQYQAKSGLEIDVIDVDQLSNGSNAVGGLFLRDCVATIRIQKGLSELEQFQTICHEMLHLELSLRGYPLLEPLDNDENAKNLAAHLESLLQRLLIMPVEKAEFGYDPYVSEHKVADSLYKSLTHLTDFRSPTDSLRQFLYSAWGVAFVRVATLAGDSVAFRKLKDFFFRNLKCTLPFRLRVASSNSLKTPI